MRGMVLTLEDNLIPTVVIEIEPECDDVSLRHIGLLQRCEDQTPINPVDSLAGAHGSLGRRIPFGTRQRACRTLRFTLYFDRANRSTPYNLAFLQRLDDREPAVAFASIGQQYLAL